jgi:hypothetical protein
MLNYKNRYLLFNGLARNMIKKTTYLILSLLVISLVLASTQFIVDDPYGDRVKSVLLLKDISPLEGMIDGKRSKPVLVREEFDVTTLENYVMGGSTYYGNMIMRDGNRYREL